MPNKRSDDRKGSRSDNRSSESSRPGNQSPGAAGHSENRSSEQGGGNTRSQGNQSSGGSRGSSSTRDRDRTDEDEG